MISGAGAGVGRACAIRFASAGWKLGLICRDASALKALEEELRERGAHDIVSSGLDVSDADAVEAAAVHFRAVLGPIDVWVNDAMVTVFSPVSEMTSSEFRRVTEVTYLGVVYGSMAALKQMSPLGRGHIINIGSALAYRGIPLQSAYCGAKHAIRGFTASLRSELMHAKSGVDVSIIELPAMNTPQFDWARTHMARQPKPMGTVYQPEVAAEAVLRAIRRRPREYWVGSSTFWTIVGNMILPDLMDWYLGRTAVQGQETSQNVRPDRRDNLYHPITDLHRTHGVFESGASNTAVILSGAWARAGVVACGALTCVLVGAVLL